MDSQLPPAHLQQSKSPGKSFLPAVPTASKIKPSLSFHAGTESKAEDSMLGFFPFPMTLSLLPNEHLRKCDRLACDQLSE